MQAAARNGWINPSEPNNQLRSMQMTIQKLLAAMCALLLLLGTACAEQTLVSNALPVDFSAGLAPDPAGFSGEWSYSDPTLTITIDKGRQDECDFWVADIRIGHPSQLRTAAADGFDSDMVLPASTLARRMNAVLAVNGDYFSYNKNGFTLRQGQLYKDRLNGRRDLLLIDEDGDFHFMRKARKGTGVTEINGKKIINVFTFGPVLVDNGELNQDYSCDEMAFGDHCQRMCIGQVGKLHYKVVCCAAPDRGSEGMTIRQFANLVHSLGVTNAYNLDGGNSTMLVFNGEKLNDVDNPKARDIADIIYFASAAE